MEKSLVNSSLMRNAEIKILEDICKRKDQKIKELEKRVTYLEFLYYSITKKGEKE